MQTGKSRGIVQQEMPGKLSMGWREVWEKHTGKCWGEMSGSPCRIASFYVQSLQRLFILLWKSYKNYTKVRTQ